MDKTTSDPLIGRAISQYEVIARIGGGGMGVVYKATDQKLGRAVALKFLPPQWSHDEGAKQRFLREAQAASATNHRNICIIHDIARTDDGQLFIVMAYYEGQTLKQKLEAGPIPVAEALEIAAEMAEGLAKAHAQGVVHRDVKPGNLMITDDGVKVLDFGLAKFADSLQLTMAGSTVGTVAYMSPEQARGEEADARSDVWAIGVVLYEMLAGRVPFKGAYPEATFHAIKNEPVPPFGADREVPPALEMLVLRALEKDPERRYQSAREVARDLRLIQGRTVPLDLRTEPLPLLPGLTAPQSLSWSQRVRRAATPARAIAAVVAVAAVVAGTYAWMARPVVRIPVAIAPVANHTGEPELDAYRMALTQSLVEEVSDSPNMRVVPYLRLLEIVRRFIDAGDVSSTEAIQAIATQSGVSFVLIPSLEYRNAMWLAQVEVRNAQTGTVSKTYETESQTSTLARDTAHRLIAALADSIQAHFKTNGPGRSYGGRPASTRFRSLDAALAFEEGLSAYEQMEYAAALIAFRRADFLDNQHAMTAAWLSRVLLLLKQGNEAVAAGQRAKQLVTLETPEANVAFVEAVAAENQADFPEAERQYRRLAALAPDGVRGKTELADFLKRQYRNQEAIDAYHDVLRLDSEFVHPHVELCQLYTRLPDYPLAQQQARSAVERYRTAQNRVGEAQALLCFGELQRLQGNLTDARQNIEAARAIFEGLGLRYSLSRVYQYLGAVSFDARDYPQAVKLFEESLSRSRDVGNREMEGVELINLGVIHERLGQRVQALNYYEQGRDVYKQSGDERRAAELEINAASLLVEAGSQQANALRRAMNARATLHMQGRVEFEVIAMEVEAAGHLYAGRNVEGRRQLLEALSLAKERKVTSRLPWITVRLAESDLATGDYEVARQRLEAARGNGAGREDPAVTVTLGRLLIRLGDFANARARLDEALAEIQATKYLALAPIAHTALGELEFESANLREAGRHFQQSAAFWTDDLPDAASVEAKCYQGLINMLEAKAPTASGTVESGMKQAQKMGRLSLEAECRLHLARVFVTGRRYAEAIAALDEIPPDSKASIGSELQAQVHYWRARALDAQGDYSGAGAEAALARNIVRNLQDKLPSTLRDRFASRPVIREIENNPVRERR